MNPILLALLTYALSNVKPADVAKIVNELIGFLDQIMSKRGFFVRQMWNIAKSQITPDVLQKEVQSIMAEIQAKLAESH